MVIYSDKTIPVNTEVKLKVYRGIFIKNSAMFFKPIRTSLLNEPKWYRNSEIPEPLKACFHHGLYCVRRIIELSAESKNVNKNFGSIYVYY